MADITQDTDKVTKTTKVATSRPKETPTKLAATNRPEQQRVKAGQALIQDIDNVQLIVGAKELSEEIRQFKKNKKIFEGLKTGDKQARIAELRTKFKKFAETMGRARMENIRNVLAALEEMNEVQDADKIISVVRKLAREKLLEHKEKDNKGSTRGLYRQARKDLAKLKDLGVIKEDGSVDITAIENNPEAKAIMSRLKGLATGSLNKLTEVAPYVYRAYKAREILNKKAEELEAVAQALKSYDTSAISALFKGNFEKAASVGSSSSTHTNQNEFSPSSALPRSNSSGVVGRYSQLTPSSSQSPYKLALEEDRENEPLNLISGSYENASTSRIVRGYNQASSSIAEGKQREEDDEAQRENQIVESKRREIETQVARLEGMGLDISENVILNATTMTGDDPFGVLISKANLRQAILNEVNPVDPDNRPPKESVVLDDDPIT